MSPNPWKVDGARVGALTDAPEGKGERCSQPASRPLLLFDVTNLARCLEHGSPTGIDRIDWIYAYWISKGGAFDLRACFVRGRSVTVLGPRVVGELCRELRRLWKGRRSAAKARGVLSRSARGWLLRKLRGLVCRSGVVGVAGRPAFYLNVSQRNLASPVLLEFIDRTGVRPVCVIHDLLPITHPRFFPVGAGDVHLRKLDAMLSRKALLICGSNTLAREIETLGVERGYSQTNVITARFGTWPRTSATGDGGGGRGPYFLQVATFEPRKNQGFMVDVWARWVDSQRDGVVPELVMAGREGEVSAEVSRRLSSQPMLGNRVRILHGASDDEILELVRNASALLIPSVAEGYGLPLFEAFANSCPVIASDIPVFRELGEGIPLLLPVSNCEVWLDALRSFQLSESARQERLLVDWRRPTWACHFRTLANTVGRLA